LKTTKQSSCDPSALRKRRQERWESKWARDNFNPKWAGRGITAEITELAQSGVLPVNGRVLDIGCGLGEIAAHFAEHGHQAMGIDLAETAVAEARSRHSGYDNLEFKAADITDIDSLGDSRFDILIDRGCLHTIPESLIPDYVNSVSKLSSENAHLIIFTRAFRKQNRLSRLLMGELIEEKRRVRKISRAFAGRFRLVSWDRTHLGRPDDPDSITRMPGMVFRLVKI
jgi:2-polyprenyl-3-methyl-5-hydroxy-6-metoxy-1,4-benzoquinol methylase